MQGFYFHVGKGEIVGKTTGKNLTYKPMAKVVKHDVKRSDFVAMEAGDVCLKSS